MITNKPDIAMPDIQYNTAQYIANGNNHHHRRANPTPKKPAPATGEGRAPLKPSFQHPPTVIPAPPTVIPAPPTVIPPPLQPSSRHPYNRHPSTPNRHSGASRNPAPQSPTTPTEPASLDSGASRNDSRGKSAILPKSARWAIIHCGQENPCQNHPYPGALREL